MTYDQIPADVADSVFTPSLNRPHWSNAFAAVMGDEITHANYNADDQTALCLILPDRTTSFYAGTDRFALARPSPTHGSFCRDNGCRVTMRLMSCRKPVAATNGMTSFLSGATRHSLQVFETCRTTSHGGTIRFSFRCRLHSPNIRAVGSLEQRTAAARSR